MKKNMSSADRAGRLIIAISIAVIYFTNVVTGTLGILLMLLALVFVLTSLIGYCPLYSFFNIHTNKKMQ